MRAVASIETVSGYDAVVLGSAVYRGSWLEDARAFAFAHSAALRERPVWLFSSEPVDRLAGHERPGYRPAVDITSVVAAVRPVEHRAFPGPIDQHGGAQPLAGSMVHRQADVRDWPAVRRWVVCIAETLAAPGRAAAG